LVPQRIAYRPGKLQVTKAPVKKAPRTRERERKSRKGVHRGVTRTWRHLVPVVLKIKTTKKEGRDSGISSGRKLAKHNTAWKKFLRIALSTFQFYQGKLFRRKTGAA